MSEDEILHAIIKYDEDLDKRSGFLRNVSKYVKGDEGHNSFEINRNDSLNCAYQADEAEDSCEDDLLDACGFQSMHIYLAKVKKENELLMDSIHCLKKGLEAMSVDLRKAKTEKNEELKKSDILRKKINTEVKLNAKLTSKINELREETRENIALSVALKKELNVLQKKQKSFETSNLHLTGQVNWKKAKIDEITASYTSERIRFKAEKAAFEGEISRKDSYVKILERKANLLENFLNKQDDLIQIQMRLKKNIIESKAVTRIEGEYLKLYDELIDEHET